MGKVQELVDGVPVSRHWLNSRVGNAIGRCNNPNDKDYHLYGGRGIKCKFSSAIDFVKYLLTLDNCDPEMEMDRLDNDGNYEPGNIRFVDHRENTNNRSNNVRYEYNGNSMTISEWSRETGLPKTTISGRIAMGWDIKDVMEKPVMQAERFELNGESKTLAEWSEDIGIRPGSLKKRIRKWGLEKALTTPRHQKKLVEWKGESKTLAEWSKEIGINESTLYYRIYKMGWTVKESFTTSNDKSQRIFEHNGECKTIREWSEVSNVDYEVFYSRVCKMEWSVKEALETPRCRPRLIEWNGESIPISEWSRRTGIKLTTLYARLHKWGWTVDRAFSTPVKPKGGKTKDG